MKKINIFATVTVLFLCNLLQGAQITQETALQVAQNYLRQGTQLRSAVSCELDLIHTATAGKTLRATGSQPAVYYYVFNINNEDGFIIISGDDTAIPVLGYSHTGKYSPDNQPPAFTYWMEYLEQDIEYAIRQQLTQDEKTKTQWKTLLNGTPSLRQITAVEPLIKTQWNQFAPYNKLCPIINGERTVTGCVATAMAQVMKYHNHPARGTGSSAAYTTGTGISIPAVSFEVDYLWDKMEDTYPYLNPVDPDDAVATLMYHCGVSVRMGYDIAANGGSGAVTQLAVESWTKNFGYDKSLHVRQRAIYDDASWESMLKAEIDAGRPVLYTGRSNSAGHAFVCDGYDDTGKFHFNWGWGGMYDGYFVSNSLNPGTGGAGSGEGTYNLYQTMYVNVMPDQGGEPLYEITLFPGTNMTYAVSSVDRGEVFTVNVPIFNSGATDFTGIIGIATIDENNNILQVIGETAEFFFPSTNRYAYGYPVSCIVPASVAPGDYTIRPFAKPKDGEWAVINAQIGYTDKLPLEVKAGILTHGMKLISNTPFSLSSNNVGRGEIFTAKFAIQNTYPNIYEGSIGVGLFDSADNLVKTISGRDVRLSSMTRYTDYSMSCAVPSDVTPGNYKVRIIAKPDTEQEWSIVWGQTNVTDILDVTVSQEVAPDNSRLMLMNSDSSIPGLYVSPETLKKGGEINVRSGVINMGTGPFAGQLEVGIYTQAGELIQLIESKNFTLDNYQGGACMFKNLTLTHAGAYKLRLYSIAGNGEKKLVENFMSFLNDIDITIEDDVPTLIADTEELPISFAPNPVKDILYISYLNMPVHTIYIYSLTGAIRQIIPVHTENEKITLSLTHLPPGMYMLHLITENNEYKTKIMKD